MKIEVPSESTAQTRLCKAILFYTGGFDLCTMHEIEDNVIQPGKALEISELEMLFKSGISHKAKQKWIIPLSLIDFGPGVMTWFCKAHVASIFWTVKDKGLKKFNASEILWPSLIFRAEGNSLSVWAVKSNSRDKSKLYKAPFLNAYESGNICTGDAPKFEPNPENIQKIEESFFNSAFSHGFNTNKKLVKYPRGHNAFWKNYCAECKTKIPKRFPNEILIPAEQKL